jgi:hypothetical protein
VECYKGSGTICCFRATRGDHIDRLYCKRTVSRSLQTAVDGTLIWYVRTYWVVNFWKCSVPFESPCISYREAGDSVRSSFSPYRTSVELHSTTRFIIPGPSSGSNLHVILLLPSSDCSVNPGDLWCYGYLLALDCWYPQKHFGFQMVNIIIPSASRSWNGLFRSGFSTNILYTNLMQSILRVLDRLYTS